MKLTKKVLFSVVYCGICLLTCYPLQLKSQSFDTRILSKDVDFEVYRNSLFSPGTTKRNSATLTLEVDLPQEVIDSFIKLPKSFILKLLKDTATDWATNLILYDLFKKDAFLFSGVIHSRNDWLPMKETEIRHWKKKLKGKKALQF